MNPIYAKTAQYKKYIIKNAELSKLKSSDFQLEDFVSYFIKKFDLENLMDKYRVKFSSLQEVLERTIIKQYYIIINKILDVYSILNPQFLNKREILKTYFLLEDIKIIIFSYKNNEKFENISAFLNNPKMFEKDYKNKSLEILLKRMGFNVDLKDELEAINEINYKVFERLNKAFPNNKIIKKIIDNYNYLLKSKEERWGLKLDKYYVGKRNKLDKLKNDKNYIAILRKGIKDTLNSENYVISMLFLLEYNKKTLIKLINSKAFK